MRNFIESICMGVLFLTIIGGPVAGILLSPIVLSAYSIGVVVSAIVVYKSNDAGASQLGGAAILCLGIFDISLMWMAFLLSNLTLSVVFGD